MVLLRFGEKLNADTVTFFINGFRGVNNEGVVVDNFGVGGLAIYELMNQNAAGDPVTNGGFIRADGGGTNNIKADLLLINLGMLSLLLKRFSHLLLNFII